MSLMTSSSASDQTALLINEQGQSRVLLVCEHASNYIPDRYNGLGLDAAAKRSHAAWDIGAKALSEKLSERLDAKVVMSGVSRLVYDCNRPPNAPDAMPEKSEIIAIKGNVGLSVDDKKERICTVYEPFKKLLSDTLNSYPQKPILVTIHSFTPLYFGKLRTIEIGLIHDEDNRLAVKMVELAQTNTDLKVSLNEPYSKEDGVAHTLALHGTRNGLINVMIEVRNDLLETADQQTAIAQIITNLLQQSILEMNEVLTIDGAA